MNPEQFAKLIETLSSIGQYVCIVLIMLVVVLFFKDS